MRALQPTASYAIHNLPRRTAYTAGERSGSIYATPVHVRDERTKSLASYLRRADQQLQQYVAYGSSNDKTGRDDRRRRRDGDHGCGRRVSGAGCGGGGGKRSEGGR